MPLCLRIQSMLITIVKSLALVLCQSEMQSVPVGPLLGILFYPSLKDAPQFFTQIDMIQVLSVYLTLWHRKGTYWFLDCKAETSFFITDIVPGQYNGTRKQGQPGRTGDGRKIHQNPVKQCELFSAPSSGQYIKISRYKMTGLKRPGHLNSHIRFVAPCINQGYIQM